MIKSNKSGKNLRLVKEIISQLPGCQEMLFAKYKAEILESTQFSKDFKEKANDLLELFFINERNERTIEVLIKNMFFSFKGANVWSLIKLIQDVVIDIIGIKVDDKLKFNILNNFIKTFSEFENKIHQKYSYSSSEFIKNISENSSIIFLIKENKENWPVKYISSNIENFGYPVDDFIYKKKKYSEIIHHEDYDRTVYMTSYCKIKKQNYFTQNYRLITAAKEIRWIEDRTILFRNENNEVEYFQSLLIDVTEKTIAQSELALKNRALEVAANGILICDSEKKIVWVNGSFTRLTGYLLEDLKNKSPNILINELEENDSIEKMWKKLFCSEVWNGKYSSQYKYGGIKFHETVITPVNDQNGILSHFIWIISEITEKKKLEDERKLIEAQLRHSQKMESIGQLAAGIAHEINTPIQFVGDNLNFLKTVFDEYNEIINESKKIVLGENIPDNSKVEYLKILEEKDLDFIQEEIPRAIEQSDDGIKRVSKIVKAMKKFAHSSDEQKELNDVNRLLENTSIVARNEWKYIADLEIISKPDLPQILCYADELNQVFLNMIINSAHSIKEKIGKTVEKGLIKIELNSNEEYLTISIKDNGNGIPGEILDKIYDPFFTTKEVGKGTGQGLAIAHNIITDKHKGKIEVNSEINKGTEFIIYLPITEIE